MCHVTLSIQEYMKWAIAYNCLRGERSRRVLDCIMVVSAWKVCFGCWVVSSGPNIMPINARIRSMQDCGTTMCKGCAEDIIAAGKGCPSCGLYLYCFFHLFFFCLLSRSIGPDGPCVVCLWVEIEHTRSCVSPWHYNPNLICIQVFSIHITSIQLYVFLYSSVHLTYSRTNIGIYDGSKLCFSFSLYMHYLSSTLTRTTIFLWPCNT